MSRYYTESLRLITLLAFSEHLSMSNQFKSRYLDMLRKYNSLMMEYEELLYSDDFKEEDLLHEIPFPPFHRHRIYIERQCAFAQEPGKNMEMLTLPGQRASGLREIRDFTAGTGSLIIVDPYIFSGRSEDAEKIAADFKKTVRAAGKHLDRIHFVYDEDPSKTTTAIRSSIKKMLKEESVNVTEAKSDILHDRIWISDRNKAIVVGSSLNGIGGQLAFILPLPKEDLNALLKYLDEKVISRAKS